MSSSRKFPLKKVTIDWTDACTEDAWRHLSDVDIHGGINVRSTGFLMKEDKKGVTIAASVADNGMCFSKLFIPRQWIKRIA